MNRGEPQELQGWNPDPYGMHQERYFSAGRPTKLVRDGHVETYDELPAGQYKTKAAAPVVLVRPTASHRDTNPPQPGYVCPFCRQPSDGAAVSCPACGAGINLRLAQSESGWKTQPPIRNMARLQFGESRCQITGERVPIANFRLAGKEQIYFFHHHLLWTDPTIEMEGKRMDRPWGRRRAGMPLVMLEATGSGPIALSPDHPGEVIAVPLDHRGGVVAAEHRFLAATDNIDYDWQQTNVAFQTQKRDEWEAHFPLGRYLDVFRSKRGPGLLLLHAPGNAFVRHLAAKQTICIKPRALVYADQSVTMELHIEVPKGARELYIHRGVSNMIYVAWLRLRGPGRVAIGSVFERPEPSGPPVNLAANGNTLKAW